MSLSAVYMPADVYYACSLHALSVEKEEIMGLLIGKFEGDIAHIKSIIVLQRSDKKKDRVEFSTEQLHSAIMKTTELSESLGVSVNVIGWYHSHPHITVQPSRVDLMTQASYQMMDSRFVGIIFSVFNEDKLKGQEIQVTCFQALPSKQDMSCRKAEVPLFIEGVQNFSSTTSESIFQLPQIISEEDFTNYDEISKNMQNNYLSKLHNDSAFVMSQCHILRSIVNPLLLNAELRLLAINRVIRELKTEESQLKSEINKLGNRGKEVSHKKL